MNLRQILSGFFVMTTLGVVALSLVGGCPTDSSGNPGSVLDPVDGDPTIADDTGTPDAGPDAQTRAVDGVARVEPDTASWVELSGRSGSGAPLSFSIVSPPAIGTLGAIQLIDAMHAEVAYTPPAGFVGQAQFSFQVDDGQTVSEPATIVLLVFPDVRFELNRYAGDPPLTVTGQAFTVSGAPLPDVVDYEWNWNGVTDRGSMSTHGQRSYTFMQSGTHVVTLSLIVAGLSQPIACTHGTSGSATVASVSVTAPPVNISGVVLNENNMPLGGVTIVPSSAADPVMTGSGGGYVVTVPGGWTGTLEPQHDDYTFEPESRTFISLTSNQSNESFMASPLDAPPPQLVVTPESDLSSSGSAGGPFAPGTLTYTVKNDGQTRMAWLASATADWATVSPREGSLDPGMSASVTLTVNTTAAGLAPGVYTGIVAFLNDSNGSGDTSRSLKLTVTTPPADGHLSVSPATDLSSSGVAGGPFTPTDKQYVVENTGGLPIDWSANATQAWVSVAPSSGTLNPGTSALVTVAVDDDANALAAGNYSDAVSFVNTTNGGGDTTRDVDLTVFAPAGVLSISPGTDFLSSGNAGGPFAPDTKDYTLKNVGGQSINWSVSATASWITIEPAGAGQLAPGATEVVTVRINENANGLVQSAYGDTVAFTNETNHDGDTTRDVELIVNPPPGALRVTPADAFVSSGVTGGPFTPGSKDYVLENTGDQAIDWIAGATADWLTVAPSAGTLNPSDTVTVTVTIDAEANALAPGNYNDVVSFVNATNGDGSTTRAVDLTVEPPPGMLSVTPGTDFASSGVAGGPFGPVSKVYALENTGGQALSWSAGATQTWVTVTPTSGALNAGDSVNVTVSINGNAAGLAPGNYGDTVSLVNTTNGDGSTARDVDLTVNAPPGALSITPTTALTSSGPEGGPFTPASTDYVLENVGGQALSWSATPSANWITAAPASGSLNAGETVSVTVSLNANAAALAAGPYAELVLFENLTNGDGDDTRGVDLTVHSAANPLTPIARWDVVPHQRISAGETFNAGVVAFSKEGIQKVRFEISGQGYTGPTPIDVTEMTLNPRTDVWEYWAPIAADDFATDGPIMVEATVYGNDGGVRDKDTDGGGLGLDALSLVVNPGGTLPQPEAWVDATVGDDGTGEVNNAGLPFATVGQAVDAIRAWRDAQGYGNNADGGIVRLNPGTHDCSNGGVWSTIYCEDEWVTITTAAGGTQANTILRSGQGPRARKIRVRGITLENTSGKVLSMDQANRAESSLWAVDCTLMGSDRHSAGSHPLDGCGANYYTETAVHTVDFASPGGDLCRNLAITSIGNDAFQNVPLVIHCTADDIDPGSTSWHADAWQHWGGNDVNRIDDNVIVYGFSATNCRYQGVFIRGDTASSPTHAQGMAFVNVHMSGEIVDGRPWSGWYRWVDHLLLWHCTFQGQHFAFYEDTYSGYGEAPPDIQNCSVVGNVFRHLVIPPGSVPNMDFDQWHDNHYEVIPGDPGAGGNTSEPRGTGFTTGPAQLDAGGRPLAGSPLLDRVNPCRVPVDVSGGSRAAPADVGAFER